MDALNSEETMSVSSNETDLSAKHDNVLDAIRDLWPQLKGINILLFQNDLFRRIRQLEVKVEGLGSARGFLPASFADMVKLENIDTWISGNEEYEKSWTKLIDSAGPETEDELDPFEDDVCGWVQDMIPVEYNFFTAALDEGTLNAEWLGRAQMFFEKAAADAITTVKAEAPSVEINAIEEFIKPTWRSANTRRRQSGFGITSNGQTVIKKRARLTRRQLVQRNK